MKKYVWISAFLLTMLPLMPFALDGLMNYQGRLLDAKGNPITKEVEVTFTFYDAESEGSIIGGFSDTDLIKPDENGIFSTLIGDEKTNLIKPDIFYKFEAIWINVNIDGENLIPRKKIVIAPYALRSEYSAISEKSVNSDFVGGYSANSLIKSSGGKINGSIVNIPADPENSSLLFSKNQGSGPSIGAVNQANLGKGIYGEASYDSASGNADGVYGLSRSGLGAGVHGNSLGISGKGIYGESSGDSASAVYGESSGLYAAGVKGIASNTGDISNLGGDFISYGKNGAGIKGQSVGLFGKGVWGIASNKGSDVNYGGYFTSNGFYGIGVYGESENKEGITNYGGYFKSAGMEGIAVRGTASATGNYVNRGGYFEAAGSSAQAVYAIASSSTGTNYGAYIETNSSGGRAVFGKANSVLSSSIGIGGHFETDGGKGTAVLGRANYTGTGTTMGGYFSSESSTGKGIKAEASGTTGRAGEFLATGNSGIGIHSTANAAGDYINYAGYFDARGNTSRGVYATVNGSNAVGVYGAATNTTSAETTWGGYFSSTSPQSIGAQGSGKLYDFYASGTGANYGPFTGSHEVKLENGFPSDIKQGMIVSCTGEAAIRGEKFSKESLSSTLPTVSLASKEKDKKVLGVFLNETKLFKDHWYKPEDNERFAVINALGEGRVWVCSISGNIESGDYITTSNVPGYGMKQDDDLLHSYTVGKAIEDVDWNKVEDEIIISGVSYKIALIAIIYVCG